MVRKRFRKGTPARYSNNYVERRRRAYRRQAVAHQAIYRLVNQAISARTGIPVRGVRYHRAAGGIHSRNFRASALRRRIAATRIQRRWRFRRAHKARLRFMRK